MNFIKELEDILERNYEINRVIYDNNTVPLIKIEYVKKNENKIIEIKEASDKIIEDIKQKYNIDVFPINKKVNINVRLSGYKFSDIKLLQYEKIIEEKNIQNKIIFEIDPNLNNNNNNFYRVDFRELIELYINDTLFFHGFITFIHLKKAPFKIFHVYCEDLHCIIDLSRVNDLFFYQNGSLNEFIKLYYDMRGIEISKNDLIFHANERLFRLIVPLKGLNIREKLNLGKCIIVPDLTEVNLDNNFDVLRAFDCFAILNLNGASLFEVYQNGVKIIRTTINLLNFRIKIPNYFDGYDYFDQNSTIEIGDYIYIEDFETKSSVIISEIHSKRPIFEKDYLFYHFFRPVFGLINKYIKPEFKSKEEKKRIEKEILILSYLNSAEKKVSENINAAFLDLWISIELLISRFKPEITKLFQDNDSKRIENNLKRIFRPKYYEIKKKEIDGIITGEEKEKLCEELRLKKNQVKSEIYRTPMNKQLDLLLDNYKLSLSDEEKDLYKFARQKRNDIIHGNEIAVVSREEYNIVSKIIYLILKEEFFKVVKNERKNDFRFDNPLVPIYFRMIIDLLIRGLDDSFKETKELIELNKIVNRLSNLGMISPKDIIPDYEEFSPLMKNPMVLDKVVKLGPAYLVGLEFLRKKDPRIPVLCDVFIEKLGEFLALKYEQNEKILYANELRKHPHFIGDLGMYYRTFLNNVITVLCDSYPVNKFFKEAQNQLNWLDKSGIQSYNVREAMKGIERWQKKRKIK